MRKRLRCVILGAALCVGCAGGSTAVQPTAVWDAQAAKEAENTMHKLHHAWDQMDMAQVENAIADDGFLTTFEYTGREDAVRLATKAELVAWLKKQFEGIKQAGGTTVAVPQRKMECRATANVAFCTEECNILVKRGDGKVELSPHRGTSVLRKGADGWKFAHWHVSETGTPRVVDANNPEVAAYIK